MNSEAYKAKVTVLAIFSLPTAFSLLLQNCRLKMPFILQIVCLSLLFCVYCGAQKVAQVCFPIGTTTEGPTLEPQQEQPSKIDFVGVPGQKGERGVSGPPGRCACDPNAIERLQNKMEANDDLLIKLIDELRQTFRDKVCLVGMKDGRVADEDITVSSTFAPSYHPKNARFDLPSWYDNQGWFHFRYGGWLACKDLCNNTTIWIQVDLKLPVRITGVVTQGIGDSRYQEYVTSYKISYGNQTHNLEMMQHTNGTDIIFPGNKDSRISMTNIFPRPIVARYFRLIVQTWYNHPVLRLEYLTC